MSLPKLSIKILKKKSLLAILENSIKGGDNYFFRNLYAIKSPPAGGEVADILEDGKNSCGVFVSWILLALELIKHPHASVDGTEKDMLESGWQEIKDLRSGAVIFWEPKEGQDKLLGEYNVAHRHSGFYAGNNEAISNDSRNTGFPHKHHFTYNETRKIEKIYWHKELDESRTRQ